MVRISKRKTAHRSNWRLATKAIAERREIRVCRQVLDGLLDQLCYEDKVGNF